jgi:hypothetical protein
MSEEKANVLEPEDADSAEELRKYIEEQIEKPISSSPMSEKEAPKPKRAGRPGIERYLEVNHPPGLNIREEPSKSAAVNRIESHGAKLPVYEETDGWVKTKDGWCMREFLK